LNRKLKPEIVDEKKIGGSIMIRIPKKVRRFFGNNPLAWEVEVVGDGLLFAREIRLKPRRLDADSREEVHGNPVKDYGDSQDKE
jgi:antitoxin component of MazEF toxin-antitoxin module